MATINVTKALIGAEDLSVGNGTFSRTTSTGGTANVNKLNLASFAEGWGTLTNTGSDGTPSVSGRRCWKTGGLITITEFDGGVDGQEIVILAATATTTVQHDGDNINLAGNAHFDMVLGDTLTLVADGAGDAANWYEIARTFANSYAGTIAADATTASAKNVRILTTSANTGSTAFTNLTDGVAGQIVTIIGTDGNSTTIADGGTYLKLDAAGTFTANAEDTITFVTPNGTTWYEIGRSNN